MFSKQRQKRNQKPRLDLQQLEPRTMLAALSFEQCGNSEVVQALSQARPDSTITDSDLATALSFSGRRFQWPFVQPPTTEQLGEIDEAIPIEGSNSFFDRVDRYEFEVSADGRLDVDLEFDRSTFARIAVFDQSRKAVVTASLRYDSDASIFADLDAGQYTAIVFGGYGRYELDFDFVPEIDETPVSNPVSNDPEDSIDDPNPDEPAPTPTQTELPEASYYGSNLDWNLNSVNAPEAWQAGYGGDGVVVAVIDTGINISHSDLNDNVWVNSDEIAGDGIDNDGNGFVDDRYGWNFVGNNPNVSDDNGHGTHVAGTVAAEQNGFGATGVAPDAEVMAIKVLNRDGSGFVSSIANGIRYAVNNGADIINLSLGGGFSSAIESAINYAAANNVLVVAAAGNESANIPGNPASLSNRYSNVLSVGAYDSSNRIARFSNGVGGSGAVQVDAPGVNIYSTAADGRYTWLSGTSMAAPHVAGLAALTLSANSNLTASSLRNIIVQSSNRSAAGSDARGVVNASLAIPQALNGGTANSVSSIATNSNSASRFNSIFRALSLNAQIADLPDLSDEIDSRRSLSGDTQPALEPTSKATEAGTENGANPIAFAAFDDAFGNSESWLT